VPPSGGAGAFSFRERKGHPHPGAPVPAAGVEEHAKPDEVAKRFLARVATLLGSDFGA
jgi:hypothetical protein